MVTRLIRTNLVNPLFRQVFPLFFGLNFTSFFIHFFYYFFDHLWTALAFSFALLTIFLSICERYNWKHMHVVFRNWKQPRLASLNYQICIFVTLFLAKEVKFLRFIRNRSIQKFWIIFPFFSFPFYFIYYFSILIVSSFAGLCNLFS